MQESLNSVFLPKPKNMQGSSYFLSSKSKI